MKTALQQVFSDLEELHPNLLNVYTTEGKEFINHFHKYLELEKQQIIDAFGIGCQVESTRLIGYQDMAEQYYNETFKNSEQ